MRRLIVSLALALVLVASFAVPAFAATTADVTVTATPAYVSLSLGAVTTWPINGVFGGDSKIRPSTTYYANPTGDTTEPTATVVDGDCRFTFTNDGNVAIDIKRNFADFAGIVMTNINTGYANNGATAFGASGYASDAAWPGGAVIFKNAASGVFITNLAATFTKKWGVALKTQSDPFASATSMTSTITCTAIEHVGP
jgi:hypothetical protein